MSNGQGPFDRAEKALSNLLAKGGYRAGDRLPPEPELARQLGISRATLREVLRTFEAQGLIVRRRGVGTFVNAPPVTVETGLEVLESLDQILSRRGTRAPARDIRIVQATADPKAAARLDIPVGSPVILITRTRLVEGIPVTWHLDVIPTDVISFEEMESIFTGSVLDTFRARGHPIISYAHTDILAVEADAQLAQALNVKEGRSLLFLEQVLYDTNNRPVSYERHYYVPGLVRFHVIRRPR